MASTFVHDYIRLQFQQTIKNQVLEIINEEAAKAGKEVAKRVLELAAEVAIVVEKNSMDYMMANQVKIHVHIPAVNNE